MKKILYLFVLLVLCRSYSIKAQSITGYRIFGSSTVSPVACSEVNINVGVFLAFAGTKVVLLHEGTADTSLVMGDTASFALTVPLPGNYSYKAYLIGIDTTSSGGILPSDSLAIRYAKLHCGFSDCGIYNDVNSNCIFDAADTRIFNPALVEISTGGVPQDTILCNYGISFPNTATAGTIFQYRLLQPPSGFTLTCPTSGILYDTVGSSYLPKRFGFSCSSSSSFDLEGLVSVRCGIHAALVSVVLRNNYCSITDADLKLMFSPKYDYSSATGTIPTSTSGSVSNWHFSDVAPGESRYFNVWHEIPSGAPGYVYGDTVNSRYELTPTIGDIVPANNIIVRIDTVRAGFDPNDISVYPSGHISPGTELEYTVRFENTGNDTAFNIHIMDTLSPYVDFNTLEVKAASHNVNLIRYSSGTDNIVKFDFPNINLLDSSYHDECNGMVIFSIKAKEGLPYGTQIFNRAGIYFDYNPVVMTNTVENIIPFPANIADVVRKGNVAVYPNPVGDVLMISNKPNQFSSGVIQNILGQQVSSFELPAANAKVRVAELPSGIYILSLKGTDGIVVTKFEKL